MHDFGPLVPRPTLQTACRARAPPNLTEGAHNTVGVESKAYLGVILPITLRRRATPPVPRRPYPQGASCAQR